MTSIVFNSVPMEEIETTWGSQPQVARVKTVIREIKRYVSMIGVVQILHRQNFEFFYPSLPLCRQFI